MGVMCFDQHGVHGSLPHKLKGIRSIGKGCFNPVVFAVTCACNFWFAGGIFGEWYGQ